MFAERPVQPCGRLAMVALVCVIGHGAAFAQTTSASVSGSVRDTQGGVLPGASVTLTSDTQGTVQGATTDAVGNFLFPYVRPDRYTLRIALQGFQSAEQAGLVVNANDRIVAGAFTLSIGRIEEQVIVIAQSSDVQLKGGERGYTLQSAAVQNLGVAGRSFFGLAALVPGVVPNSSAPSQPDAFNVNGQRSSSNNVTIDGVANVDTGSNGANLVQTNTDAIAEFKVLTSSYQAEYGRAVGGQVQVVTRSGTQRFSGSAYWYGRRSEWDENTWLNIRDGTPKEKSSRNDQGYTFGGPIYIPGVFNTAKDKLFFFWNQEFQRRKDPVPERLATVPTALERQGDFSQSVDASGNPYPYIRDYTLGLPCNTAITAGCFRHQGVLGRIDPGRLYAPTQAALSLYPLPNVTGEVGYNYKSQEPSNQPLDQSLLRVDYQLSGNWRLTGRYMWHTNRNEHPYGPGTMAVSNVPIGAAIFDVPGYNWMASASGVLNSTTAFEVSVGSAHNSIESSTANEGLTRTAAGMTSLPTLFPEVVQDDMVPTFTYGGGRVNSPAYVATAIFPFTNVNTTYDILANLTKAVGPHTLKAGLYFQRSVKDQSTTNAFNSAISFANGSGNPFDSSHPFANAALGIFQEYRQASAYAIPKWRYSNVEWYVQDNWKTFANLTLDYGVRFYFLTPQHDVSQMASNWLPDAWDAGQAVRLYAPAVAGGVRVGSDATTGTTVPAAFIGRVVPNSGNPFNGAFQAGQGISETLTDGNKFRVSPRVGFAYDVTGRQRLVVRGGFALLYDRPMGNQVFGLINNPPGMQIQVLTWGLSKDIATSTRYNPTVVLAPSEYDWKVPTVYQWNVGVQARLPLDLTLDVAYVGAKSELLLEYRNLNAVPYGAAYLAENRDPTRGQACSGCTAISPLPGGNALPADFMRPYRGYGNIVMWGYGSYSNYDALQTTVSRRLAKGLMFGAYYTWSSAKGIGGTDYEYARSDGRDREANYGPLSFDRPHVFVANFVYQTPAVAAGAWGLLTNGWQLSGNYRWLHGTPYTPGFTIGGGSVGSVNLTGSNTDGARIALTGETISRGWSSDPYRQFDVAAFTAPTVGSVGLESPRYTMYLPPASTLDLSLSKSFPLGGRRRFEIRLDAFNALNVVNYSSVNSTIEFKSLTDSTITNLPYDASGTLVNKNGVGSVKAVGPPRQLQLMTRFTF
jgi:hypothetical protein